jgi:hypothetical protein
MRNAIMQLPETRSAKERRFVLRAALGRLPGASLSLSRTDRCGQGLDRAEVDLAAVAYMELEDREAKRALNQLRRDLDSLLRHLSESRDRITG